MDRIAGCPAWSVAEIGSEVVGLVADLGPRPGGDHHLVSMWVAPAHRGSGVARLLLAAVVAHANAQGAPGVVLDVAAGNPRAWRFYEKEGFVPTGASKPLRSHPGVLTHELRLELSVRRSGAA